MRGTTAGSRGHWAHGPFATATYAATSPMTVAPDKPFNPQDPLAFLPRQDRHKPKCGPVRKSKMGKWRMSVLIGVHVLIALHILHWKLTGSTLTPVEPSEAMQTVELGRINAGFLFFLALIAGTLVFGRFFCGWACHVVALQDLCAWFLAKLSLHPRPLRSRLLVLGPWVVAGHMFAWPLVQHLIGEKPIPKVSDWTWHLKTDQIWQTFPGPIMAIATFVVVGFLIVWWLGAKGFCTHGCPYGAFFATVDRFAPVRIKVTDACDGCGHCTSVCTSNVRVHEEVAKHGQIVDPGCMKCLDCVSVCPKEALYVGLAAPKPFTISQQRIQARADFTWWEEVLLAVVAVVATQWGWRGAWFCESIPFLLAVGLGVVTAVFALLALRLVLQTNVKFQHTVLKADGRWTRSGGLGMAGLCVWLLLTLHTGISQWRRESLHEMMDTLPVQATPAQLEDLLARAESIHASEVFDDPFVGEMLGLLLWRLGRQAEGGAELMRSYEANGELDLVYSNLNLAIYCASTGDKRLDVAEKVVRKVLSVHPQHAMAQRMLEDILRMQGK